MSSLDFAAFDANESFALRLTTAAGATATFLTLLDRVGSLAGAFTPTVGTVEDEVMTFDVTKTHASVLGALQR